MKIAIIACVVDDDFEVVNKLSEITFNLPKGVLWEENRPMLCALGITACETSARTFRDTLTAKERPRQ